MSFHSLRNTATTPKIIYFSKLGDFMVSMDGKDERKIWGKIGLRACFQKFQDNNLDCIL
jgi:hypothetical protein